VKSDILEGIGGEEVLNNLIDTMFNKFVDDPRVCGRLQLDSIEECKNYYKAYFAKALSEDLDSYTGVSIQEKHAGMGITGSEFQVFSQYLNDVTL